MKDYYSILEVSKTANSSEIKKAYRNLAKKYHPDRIKDEKAKIEAKKKFQEIQSAYEVLSDEKRRRMYDNVGHSQYSQTGGQGGFHGLGFEGFDFGDLFSQFVGVLDNEFKTSDIKYNEILN